MSCYYCGIEPKNIIKTRVFNNGNYSSNGIDRIDNSLGYELGNTVACCKICNIAKNNLTIDQWYEWLDRITKFRSK